MEYTYTTAFINCTNSKINRKNTKIIAAFPACGKTHYFENNPDNLYVLDSDSSYFSWMHRKRTKEELDAIEKEWDGPNHCSHKLPGFAYVNKIKDEEIKVRNPDFPNNYIEYIKSFIGVADYIFVSTHEVVRNALKEAGIDFYIVYPDKSLKEEWVGRCFLRGSGESFCKLIADNWDMWIDQIEKEIKEDHRKNHRLLHGEYMADALNYI